MDKLTKKLAKLTKSKKPTSEQIQNYKDKQKQRDQLKADVDSFAAIINQLRTKNGQNKGDFASGQYEELKGMIKSATQEFQKVTDPATRQQQQKAATTEGNYADKSSKDLDSDLESIQKEIVQLEQEYKATSDKLQLLDKLYKDWKKQTAIERCDALKKMITTTVLAETGDEEAPPATAPPATAPPATAPSATVPPVAAPPATAPPETAPPAAAAPETAPPAAAPPAAAPPATS